MSDHKSWFHSNTMSGLNHFLDNVTKPFDWVDKKVNFVRKIPVVNNFMDYTRHHMADTAAVAGLAAGAYFGGAALLGEGAGEAGAGAAGGAGEGTAMGSAAGTLGAADSAAAAGGLGADLGGAAVVDGTAMGGAAGELGAADSALASGDVASGAGSGFGGVGTDAGVATSPDGGAALSSQQAAAANAARMQKLGQIMQQMGKQGQQSRMVDPSNVRVDLPTLQNPYATSSMAKKTAPTGDLKQSLARGAAGCDPIDTNGVQAAAIQQISKRLVAAKARLAELQKETQ